jgi:hypothetical protein
MPYGCCPIVYKKDGADDGYAFSDTEKSFDNLD